MRDSLIDDDEYIGLGFIQLVANITDLDAIQKLLDGRYLTGSVGATTDRAVCSICRQDWTEDGACEHKPGAIYDESKCFLIMGNLDYEEYSFVNRPADRHSKVLELHYNGVRDSIEIASDHSGRICEVRLKFPQYDSADQEDTGMPDNQVDTTVADGKVEIQDNLTPSAPETPKPAKAAESTQDIQDANQDTETVQDCCRNRVSRW